ncbi:basic proline-rich protein-like isoform X1 [Canis lupus familiaris]|uniref:basic proline-rich protein-like isoform X1 n=1 Tax=Canis lupus familiaris TaxID=9615 RepID=UPI0018F7D9EA|nr:basic proline-rich protein-like isoform X1 [Canis lupus familiaris]
MLTTIPPTLHTARAAPGRRPRLRTSASSPSRHRLRRLPQPCPDVPAVRSSAPSRAPPAAARRPTRATPTQPWLLRRHDRPPPPPPASGGRSRRPAAPGPSASARPPRPPPRAARQPGSCPSRERGARGGQPPVRRSRLGWAEPARARAPGRQGRRGRAGGAGGRVDGGQDGPPRSPRASGRTGPGGGTREEKEDKEEKEEKEGPGGRRTFGQRGGGARDQKRACLASPSGNRTPVSRVTGGDTHHYTNEDGGGGRPGARPLSARPPARRPACLPTPTRALDVPRARPARRPPRAPGHGPPGPPPRPPRQRAQQSPGPTRSVAPPDPPPPPPQPRGGGGGRRRPTRQAGLRERAGGPAPGMGRGGRRGRRGAGRRQQGARPGKGEGAAARTAARAAAPAESVGGPLASSTGTRVPSVRPSVRPSRTHTAASQLRGRRRVPARSQSPLEAWVRIPLLTRPPFGPPNAGSPHPGLDDALSVPPYTPLRAAGCGLRAGGALAHVARDPRSCSASALPATGLASRGPKCRQPRAGRATLPLRGAPRSPPRSPSPALHLPPPARRERGVPTACPFRRPPFIPWSPPPPSPGRPRGVATRRPHHGHTPARRAAEPSARQPETGPPPPSQPAAAPPKRTCRPHPHRSPAGRPDGELRAELTRLSLASWLGRYSAAPISDDDTDRRRHAHTRTHTPPPPPRGTPGAHTIRAPGPSRPPPARTARAGEPSAHGPSGGRREGGKGRSALSCAGHRRPALPGNRARVRLGQAAPPGRTVSGGGPRPRERAQGEPSPPRGLAGTVGAARRPEPEPEPEPEPSAHLHGRGACLADRGPAARPRAAGAHHWPCRDDDERRWGSRLVAAATALAATLHPAARPLPPDVAQPRDALYGHLAAVSFKHGPLPTAKVTASTRSMQPSQHRRQHTQPRGTAPPPRLSPARRVHERRRTSMGITAKGTEVTSPPRPASTTPAALGPPPTPRTTIPTPAPAPAPAPGLPPPCQKQLYQQQQQQQQQQRDVPTASRPA